MVSRAPAVLFEIEKPVYWYSTPLISLISLNPSVMEAVQAGFCKEASVQFRVEDRRTDYPNKQIQDFPPLTLLIV